MEKIFPCYIAGFETDHILKISSDVITTIIRSGKLIEPTRRACFATFQDLRISNLCFPATFTSAFGYDFPEEKFAENCRSLSIEKITRTLGFKEHFCSRQSRNEKKSMWAGGFVLELIGIAGSLSGFKEVEDEATILTCLHRFGALDKKTLNELQTQILLLDEGDKVIRKLTEFLDITSYIG